MCMFDAEILKIVFPWLCSFLIGLLITPTIVSYLYTYKCWKKKSGNEHGMGDDSGTPIFNELHKNKEVNTPRMGGLVIVCSVLATVVLFWIVSFLVSGGPSGMFDILSRSETWLPLSAFLVGALVGLFDDLFQIKGHGLYAGGLPFVLRLVPALGFGAFAAYWFYIKLGVSEVYVPLYGNFELGWLFIPFFFLVFVAIFSTSNIDGLDGLAGGIMSIVYSAYGFIAYLQGQENLAALCFCIAGGTLAFLWFNIPPARFYMTEAGYNALSFALTIIVFTTNTVLLLPVIAVCLFVTELTTIMQVLSKKFLKRKIFKVAPIHHHFEAIGWPAHQVVMRYWIVSLIGAVLGVVLTFST